MSEPNSDSEDCKIGSDEHKDVVKLSAELEAAWKDAGKKEGVQVWRIEKFQVKEWPEALYGSFYDGDSYIVLRTYKEDKDSEKLSYDLHFWIGRYSSLDEKGTAAYKTVELDTFLSDVPVQYRNTQNHETPGFLALFDKEVRYMKGGIESGFNITKPTEYKPKLYHVCGQKRKYLRVKEIPCKRSNLNSGDVYLLDAGLSLYRWFGKSSSAWEKQKSLMEVNKLYEQRYSKPSKHVVYEDDEEDDFITAFGPVEDDAKEETLYDRDGRTDAAGAGEYDDVFKSLWKVNISTSSAKKKSGSDGSGKAGDVDTVLSSPSFSSALTFECVRKNTDTFALTDLQPSSIYVLQVRSDDPVQHHVYVYTSELYKSSSDDSSNDDLHAFDYGEALLSHMRLPTFHPIYVVKEGVASAGISGFRKAFQ